MCGLVVGVVTPALHKLMLSDVAKRLLNRQPWLAVGEASTPPERAQSALPNCSLGRGGFGVFFANGIYLY